MNINKIAICVICKMENHYLLEFIEYYYNLGVNKIFLYDNNDIDGEFPNEVIEKYILNGFVDLINVRGKSQIQCKVYQECYLNNGDNFDWIAFLDCDEFLVIDGFKNIQEFLSQEKFKKFDGVRVEWEIMDDNDLITVENNNYSLMNRFLRGTHVRDGKSICKTKKNGNGFTPHGICGLNYCDVNGEKCISTRGKGDEKFMYVSKNLVKTNIVLKHFFMKTIEEYVTIKMQRLYPDKTKEVAKNQLTIERFWKYNKKTQEKENWYNSYINKKE